jgi:hypothetical protein
MAAGFVIFLIQMICMGALSYVWYRVGKNMGQIEERSKAMDDGMGMYWFGGHGEIEFVYRDIRDPFSIRIRL